MKKRREKTTGERKNAIKNSIGRIILVGILLLIQLVVFTVLIAELLSYFPVVAFFAAVLSIIIVLIINAYDKVSSMKLVWVILILTFPIVGVTLYLAFRLMGSNSMMNRRLLKTDSNIFPRLCSKASAIDDIKIENPDIYTQYKYLENIGSFPVWNNTDIKYFAWAKDGFESQISDVLQAKKFIFMEYHAIENKESFEPMLNALKKKAAEGVDVRIIYDDIGSVAFLSKDFIKMLKSYNIKCRVFNPVFPVLEIFMNHRDHRKITVIDGVIGYTGGYNIANEYFNYTHPYGLWKDTGVRLEGPGVKTLTALFLEMWDFARFKDVPENHDRFLDIEPEPVDVPGYICAFGDSPLDDEPVGENVYINVLNNAKDYCWFSTPYLMISDELQRAMSLASKRGVDVRIITPGIPDKKTVYQLTRSYYTPLIEAGVKIYEFTPGFNHCKMCISDHSTAIVGTINLDYRSLYHHFENGVLIYNSDVIRDIDDDFIEFFEQSTDVTEKYSKRANVFVLLYKSILRLFAPLL